MTSKDDFNPFEDPSLQNLTDPTSVHHQSLDNYNPFDRNNPTAANSSPVPVSNPIPATSPSLKMPEISENPPAYTPTGAQNFSDDLQRRQEELERKANELQEREAQLANAPVTGSTKNWPPLPAKFCVGPCFYQDITVEIPDAYQRTVRIMYYLWILYAILLFFNMLGALALFIASGNGATFGISLLVFFFFSPMSFVCWFRPLYKAFRSDSSFNFMVFFFVFFFQFVLSVFYAVGIPDMGSCGLLNGINTLSSTSKTVSTYTVGIIAVVIGFMWAIHAMISFYMLVKIHRMYRGTTASFAKAQEELASGVMKNQHVQTAATTAVTQAARQSFNSAASGLRY